MVLPLGRADDLAEPAVGVLREAEDFVGLVATVGVGVLSLPADAVERFPGVAVSVAGFCTFSMSPAARSTDLLFCLLMTSKSELTGIDVDGSDLELRTKAVR